MESNLDGKTLRATRVASGMSFRQFAAALGIGKSSLNRFEISPKPVPRKIALALAGLQAELAARTDVQGRAV